MSKAMMLGFLEFVRVLVIGYTLARESLRYYGDIDEILVVKGS
jgi:hypothetical protein